MTGQVTRFAQFEVDHRSRELKRAGVRVRLQDQPFQILAMLLERAGDVVTRDEIRDRLWPDGTFVDFEHSMNAAIKRLRAALGDRAANPKFVETLHRRGYRFIATVESPGDGARVAAPRPAAVHRPRLVVLPFANLATDAPDYFSDGLTEEMIMQLGRRCSDRIGVLARTSSMLYKNVVRAASDIGEALRADYLVEGSVRREGDRVRITAQLIETKGETHLWANSYDRTMADCLAVQTEVASEIATALAVELLPAQVERWPGTRNPAAYQAFLRARFHWNRPGDEGLEAAIVGYDESISLDPGYAKAYSGRARARLSLCDHYKVEPKCALESAREDARRALAIDPDDWEAHLVIGEAERTLEWNWGAAEAAYRTALAANPNSDAAHRYYAVFLAAHGRAEESTALGDRAFALDPLCLTMGAATGMVHYLRGDYGAAIQRYRQVLEMEPTHAPSRRGLASSLVQISRYQEAIEVLTSNGAPADAVSNAWLGHALAVSGNQAAARAIASELTYPRERRLVPAFHLALLYTGLGDVDAAFLHIERACEARESSLDTIAVDPRFEPLRRDSRFGSLLERMNLAPTLVLGP